MDVLFQHFRLLSKIKLRVEIEFNCLLLLRSVGGYNMAFLQRTKTPPLELARKRFPRPSPPELDEALKNSLSFLIVREPFERLLSAYRDKLEGYRKKYYKILGEQIVKKFRKVHTKKVSPNILSNHFVSTHFC